MPDYVTYGEDYIAAAAVPVAQDLGNDSSLFIGGATNVSLIATSTTTTTT